MLVESTDPSGKTMHKVLIISALTAAFAGATAGYDFPHNGKPGASEM